jgi:hypothetical protein
MHKIEGLTMVKINRLTYLTFELNALIDKGFSISLKEAKQLCEEKKIFEEIERRFPFKETGLDLSVITKMEPKTKEELTDIFEDMAIAIPERKKFGVEKNGLCLLIAYSQEQIQREAKD